jgi:hypothetical protein
MKTRYSDCTYSAFISYAHADDRSNFGWISHFRRELHSKLSGDLARTPGGAKPAHLSQENGPIKGALSDELRTRINQSFALIIIAGDNYAGSEWCVEELAHFKDQFGHDGLKERLYILVLRDDVMARVEANPEWQGLALPNTVWLRCYDERNKAVAPYMNRDVLTPEFQEIVSKITDDLVLGIRASFDDKVAPAVKETELVCVPPASPRQATDTTEARVAADASSAGSAGDARNSVRIYIESNPIEVNEWKPLGRRIAEVWKDVNSELQKNPPLPMRVRGLEVDGIDPRKQRLHDADGVVLLWGKKDSHALRESIDKMEYLLPEDDAIAPGIVACLRPPQTAGRSSEALGWSVVGFENHDSAMKEEPGEANKLRSFLKDILDKRSAA